MTFESSKDAPTSAVFHVCPLSKMSGLSFNRDPFWRHTDDSPHAEEETRVRGGSAFSN